MARIEPYGGQILFLLDHCPTMAPRSKANQSRALNLRKARARARSRSTSPETENRARSSLPESLPALTSEDEGDIQGPPDSDDDEDLLPAMTEEEQVWLLDEAGRMLPLGSLSDPGPCSDNNSDIEWDHDTAIDEEDDAELDNKAELLHFREFMQKAHDEALAVQQAKRAQKKRPRQYPGNSDRSKRRWAQNRRELAAGGKTQFIQQFFHVQRSSGSGGEQDIGRSESPCLKTLDGAVEAAGDDVEDDNSGDEDVPAEIEMSPVSTWHQQIMGMLIVPLNLGRAAYPVPTGRRSRGSSPRC